MYLNTSMHIDYGNTKQRAWRDDFVVKSTALIAVNSQDFIPGLNILAGERRDELNRNRGLTRWKRRRGGSVPVTTTNG
jgi:hypothetical protein